MTYGENLCKYLNIQDSINRKALKKMRVSNSFNYLHGHEINIFHIKVYEFGVAFNGVTSVQNFTKTRSAVFKMFYV